MKVNLKIKNGMEFNIEFDSVKDLIIFVENFTRERANEMVSLDNLMAAVRSTVITCGAAKKIADSRKESDEDYEGENYDFYNDYDYFDEGEGCE